MSSARRVEAFPWNAIARSSRRVEAVLRAGRRRLESTVELSSLAERLGELVGVPIELVARDIDARLPPGAMWRLGFAAQSASGSASTGLGIAAEAPLVAALLSAFLRRPMAIVSAELTPEPALLGALSALIVEAARSTGAREALRPSAVPDSSGAAVVHFTVIVSGRPYAAAAWFPAEPLELEPRPRAGTLRALGAIEIQLPVVIGLGLATAAELRELREGDAFCPGTGLWVSRAGVGRAVLVAEGAEAGIGAELLPDGRIVVGEATKVALAASESNVKADADAPSELEQAVLEAPLVVRIELASVSLAAREWAALEPGDVIETRRRVGGPVVLRSGGRALAHGELVNVEGELGVRVTRILPPESG